MNNPYLLKKQLKDNEEELSNYLRDMNIWQEQMKRKEHSPPLNNSNEKKKSKPCNLTKTTINKISSWDYSAWDKFDVDKACENIDVPNELKNNDSGSSINKSQSQELRSKLSEGLYEKNLGNALVKNQKWTEAILRYTRAIEYYNYDPVFYANRALCYLKTNEFKLAISDCTSSLKLDSRYVKSYQRRSVAYMALKMYKEAKKDLNKILKLEPNNKQAKLDIEVVNDKLNIKKDNSNIKIQKANAVTKIQDKNSSNILFKDKVENFTVIPKWPSRVNCKQISAKQKPPHLRSKKPFCTLKIKDVCVDHNELDNIHLLQTTLKEVCENKKNDDQLKNKEVTPITNDLIQTEKKHCLVVPSPPKTYVQLKQDWAYLRSDSKLLFQYLKQIPGKRLPLIVHNSMDNDLFVDIIRILRLEFIQNGHDITDYLIGISELPRLHVLVMFCSDNEVLCIKEMLNHVSKFVSENTYKNLKNSFGL